MKHLKILLLGLIIFGCSKNNELVTSKNVGGGPYPEPTYKVDQRVENYSISRTRPEGTLGLGMEEVMQDIIIGRAL